MTWEVRPVTPELWPAFEDLFGRQGACFGCWCTYFRLSPRARREQDALRKKNIMRARIQAGPPPGLLALDGGQPVGWVQVGPRADVPEWNNRGRGSAPLQPGEELDPGVWAISCFFVRRTARGQGLMHRLVEAGLAFAAENGARLVDACPMDQSRDRQSAGLFVGSTRVFEKAGFARLAERKPGRPLMRRVLVQ